jgi:hypothetical protein
MDCEPNVDGVVAAFFFWECVQIHVLNVMYECMNRNIFNPKDSCVLVHNLFRYIHMIQTHVYFHNKVTKDNLHNHHQRETSQIISIKQ